MIAAPTPRRLHLALTATCILRTCERKLVKAEVPGVLLSQALSLPFDALATATKLRLRANERACTRKVSAVHRRLAFPR